MKDALRRLTEGSLARCGRSRRTRSSACCRPWCTRAPYAPAAHSDHTGWRGTPLPYACDRAHVTKALCRRAAPLPPSRRTPARQPCAGFAKEVPGARAGARRVRKGRRYPFPPQLLHVGGCEHCAAMCPTWPHLMHSAISPRDWKRSGFRFGLGSEDLVQ